MVLLGSAATRPTSKRLDTRRHFMRLILKPAALTGVAALLLGSVMPAETVSEQTPHEIIRVASTSIAEKLNGRIEYFEQNSEDLYRLINDALLPHFDTRYAGRLVLGKHWKRVSSEQRNDFIDAFHEFLLRSYANGVLQFDQDRIDILPAEGEQEGNRAIVKTRMRLDDGTIVPVNYSMRKSSVGWRVYDVRIEGISYIQNYRNQFNAEIHALGVDAVIERLRADNTAAGNPEGMEPAADDTGVQ